MSKQSPAILDTASAFPAMTARNGKRVYHHSLRLLDAKAASGVYAIVDSATRRVLYVGESHTGRLFDTITRHFRSWTMAPGEDSQGRRRGGTTYQRERVSVAYVLTDKRDAQDIQFAEIQRLKPRDNSVDGSTVVKVETDDDGAEDIF